MRAEDGQAVLRVADTGIGVPAEEMPRLFERFHRIENARSRSDEGSGIGLALVQELVALHGGDIDAPTAPWASGTTFTVRLPFGAAHLPADALAPAAAGRDARVRRAVRAGGAALAARPTRAPSAGGDGPTAADGPIAAAAAAARRPASWWPTTTPTCGSTSPGCCARPGYEVHTVADGRAALDAARARPPDLVVSDVMMPRLDGLQLVAALRADPRTAGTPVLLLSARAGQEASIEGLEAGADDYLVKPFPAAELLARVRANVELARLRNHHARWRTALVDSLQEAFFVCDEDGAVVEINAAFTDILGYGTEGLPYPAVQPWWPDQEAEPEAHRQVAAAFSLLVGQSRGTYTVPVTHRDGHRIWISAAFNQVDDPDSGRRMIVGTFRDVTAEHYAVQRETALAGLSMRLSQADDLTDALHGVLDELRKLWRAAGVLTAVFGDEPAPDW